MSAVYPALPKLSLRDSADDEDLTDIDDEVFIRDGKSGHFKLDNDGVKRPLMAPRKKCKKACNWETKKVPCKALLVPLCYGLFALSVLIALIVLCIYTANLFAMPLNILKNWLSHELKSNTTRTDVVPCTSLTSSVLWIRTLLKLTPEAPLRNNDVNGDGVEDVIIGFGTGLDTMDAPEYFCTMYFDGQIPCAGGVLALDGKTGETIWTHWTAHSIFSVQCGSDLTGDNIKDCIISGREGILHAIDGHDGSSIWEKPANVEEEQLLNAYDARFISDHDGDNVADLIVSHVIQSDGIQRSRILLLSGKNGDIIHIVTLPDTEQLFVAPQSIVQPDGEVIFVLATSSKTQAGGLYVVSAFNLLHGDLKLRKLRHGTGKGASLPPILVDITSDGITDIVVAMFNSTVIAYDGVTFEPLWNYTVPNSEVISIPIPGHYNDDDVPDFMVKHQVGSGFPVYYYTRATIVDGRNGKPLLDDPMEDSLSGHMSGLSVTVDGVGNDWFLHWSADCLNYEGVKERYEFLKEQDTTAQMRADLCKLRFNSTLTTRLLALSQHVAPPGISLYFSEDWKSVEYNVSADPKMETNYFGRPDSPVMIGAYAGMPFVSERSLRFQKNHRKNENFRRDKYVDLTKLSDTGDHADFQVPKSAKFEANADNFAVDDSWTDEDGHASNNYDMYDNNNDDEEQGVDYLREIRSEQRSEPKNRQRGEEEKVKIGKTSRRRVESSDFRPRISNDTRRKRKTKRKIGKRNPAMNVAPDGVQRQPPTGILLPSMSRETGKTSVDLIFATFWLPSSKIPAILLQEDLDCINKKKALFDNKVRYKENDDFVRECLLERGVDYKFYQEAMDRENVKMLFGQTTVYRMKLECVCPEDILPHQTCKNISRFQNWPQHQGSSGNGFFVSKSRSNE